MKRFILCLAALTLAGIAHAARPTLPEGFVLNAIDGIARQDKVNKDQWTFSTNVELKYLKTIFPTEIPLTILASGGLDQIRAFAKDSTEVRVKVWGILTLYRKENFLFPIQVMPLVEPEKTVPVPVETAPAADPNSTDSEVIPSDIMKLLRSQSKIDLAQISETTAITSADASLISKTGYITLGDTRQFWPDGFGRKVETADFVLLPCLTLEKTEETLARARGRYRYTISGILSRSQGRQYLLLYRAQRTYSNGNFTP
ncbi:MAG: hypothetical protein ABFD91_07800 [Anaerohalosphaeraceae bacterium]